MNKFFVLTFFLLLLTACSEESTTEVVSSPSLTLSEDEPVMNGDSLNDMITPILQPIHDKIAPIKHISGQAHTTMLRTVDGAMDSMEINTTYTITDIGKYSAPFEGDIHYKSVFELNETELQEGYYFPYNYWYEHVSWYPNWHRENLADYVHESEGVQHGFHPSPQKALDILLGLTNIGHISMYDEEQDVAKIGFELHTETHGMVMDELFLHPVEYHNEFFDASRCWYFTDKPSYIYTVVQPAAGELLSINYLTEMYCDIIEASVEITSSWSYDFEKHVEPVVVPEEIIAEAEEDERNSAEANSEDALIWE